MRSVLNGNAQLAQVAAKLFYSVVVSLNGICCKLLKSTCQSFSFRHLAGPNSRSLLVEDVLHFDREDLAVLIKLLGANVRDGIARL